MTSIPKIYSSFLRDIILIPIIHKYRVYPKEWCGFKS